MPDINELTNEQLEVLYDETVMIRNLIIEKAQKYGFTANDIMSKNMLHGIESVIGRRHFERK